MSNFEYASEKHQVPPLDNPDVRELYDYCVSTQFESETAYLQGLLSVVHACDTTYGNENAEHTDETIVAVALMLADIHRQTRHYNYFLGELYRMYGDYTRHGLGGSEKIAAMYREILEETGNYNFEFEFCPVSASILTK